MARSFRSVCALCRCRKDICRSANRGYVGSCAPLGTIYARSKCALPQSPYALNVAVIPFANCICTD